MLVAGFSENLMVIRYKTTENSGNSAIFLVTRSPNNNDDEGNSIVKYALISCVFTSSLHFNSLCSSRQIGTYYKKINMHLVKISG